MKGRQLEYGRRSTGTWLSYLQNGYALLPFQLPDVFQSLCKFAVTPDTSSRKVRSRLPIVSCHWKSEARFHYVSPWARIPAGWTRCC